MIVSNIHYLEDQDDIDQIIADEQVSSWFEKQIVQGRPHRPRSGFHFSDANRPLVDAWGNKGLCIRQCVLASHFECNETVLNARTLITFETGWLLHEMIQGFMERAGVAAGVETKYYDDGWSMLFTPDMTLNYPSEENPSLWEIKGYHQEEFDKLVVAPHPPKDASVQLMAYQYMTGIHLGYVLVLCKGKSSLMENKFQRKTYKIWRVPYDESMIADLIVKLDAIKAANETYKQTNVLPARICRSSNDKRAKTCAGCVACFASEEDREILRVVQ